MLRLLKNACLIGNFFALTPSLTSNFETTTSKCYSIFLVLLFTAGIVIASMNKNYEPVAIKFVIDVGSDFFLYVFNVTVVISLPFRKKKKWLKLAKLLKKLDEGLETTNAKLVSMKLLIGLGASMVANCVLTVMDAYALWLIGDTVIHYVKEYGTEVVLTQSLICYHFVLQSLLILFFEYYKALRRKLKQKILEYPENGTSQTENYQFFDTPKNQWVSLNDAIEIFNDIFGWPVVLSVIYVIFFMITYLDNIFYSPYGLNTSLLSLGFVLLYLVYLYGLVVMCDSVLQEAEKTCKMAIKLNNGLRKENKEVEHLLVVLRDNVPEFKMARLFSVNKASIFGILQTIISFAIVLFQLRN